jgi:hypothetical protein
MIEINKFGLQYPYARNGTRNLPIYLSLCQTGKNTMVFLLSFMFFLQQNQGRRRWNRFFWVGLERGLAQTMYTHVSKCKNGKIKLKKKIP